MFFVQLDPPQETYPRRTFQGVQKLETFNILDFPKNVALKGKGVVNATAKMGIKARIDRVIVGIRTKRDHFIMLQMLDN